MHTRRRYTPSLKLLWLCLLHCVRVEHLPRLFRHWGLDADALQATPENAANPKPPRAQLHPTSARCVYPAFPFRRIFNPPPPPFLFFYFVVFVLGMCVLYIKIKLWCYVKTQVLKSHSIFFSKFWEQSYFSCFAFCLSWTLLFACEANLILFFVPACFDIYLGLK